MTASSLKDGDRNPGPLKTRERLRRFEAARRLGRESRENCQLTCEIFATAFALSRDRVLLTGSAAKVTYKITIPGRLPEERKEFCRDVPGRKRTAASISGRGAGRPVT